MPRTLPWLVPKNEPSDSAPRRHHVKRETTATTPKHQNRKRNFLRSSPSPPSSPIHHCPSEEYLIEGFTNDDIYMMVEDEFYSIAQDFTRHLHHQEYVKQRKEVKLRNQAAIGDLARATDGVAAPLPVAGSRVDGRKRARGADLHGEGEDDGADCFVGTSLHGLMMSPRRGPSLVVGSGGVRSFTRAAAGFSQASSSSVMTTATVTSRGADDGGLVSSPLRRGVVGQGGEETASEGDYDDDDDDLDVQPDSPTRLRRPARPVKRDPGVFVSSPPKDSAVTPRLRDTARGGSTTSRACEPAKPGGGEITTQTPTKAHKPKRKSIFDDFDELPELSEPDVKVQDHTPSPFIETAQRQRIHQRDTKKKQSRLNEVPTFLL